MLRFAILKDVGIAEKVVLQYDESYIKKRMIDLVVANLSDLRWDFKKGTIEAKVRDAVRKAWEDVVSEFKQETVHLK